MIWVTANQWTLASSTITASSEATGLPAAYSQTPLRTQVWRSLQQSGVQTLDCDCGVPVEVDTVAVANARLLAADQFVQLSQLGNDPTPGTPTLVATLPVCDPETQAALSSFLPTTARHWRLTWPNAGAVANYAEVGIVALGSAFLPARGPREGNTLHRIDPSIVTSTPNGEVTITERPQYATGTFSLRWNDATDRDALRSLFREAGARTPVFVQLDPDEGWLTYYLRLLGRREFSQLTNTVLDIGLDWEEAR